MSDTATEYFPNPEDEPNEKPKPEAAGNLRPLRPGEFDPLAGDDPDAANPQRGGEQRREKQPGKPLIEFWSPSQLKDYQPPPDQNMVGDFHVQRRVPTVLAGPPGCGKSRAALWLAVMGARGKGDWFGMKVNCQFRTLIVQCENTLTRLHRDFSSLGDLTGMDEWIRISAFPPYRSFKFSDLSFREELKKQIREFRPHLIIIDPWNRVAKDSMQKDFQEALDHICEVMAEMPDAACLILHHLRKPKAEDRQTGRGLANLLSGSNILEGAARAVIVMQPASDDVEDDRVVITCCKNNDGKHGPRSAWVRKAGWFEPVPDAEFDWDEFDNGTTKREPKVKEEHIRQVFENGRPWLAHKQAMEAVCEAAGVKESAAYAALQLEGGRFSHLLMKNPATGLTGLKTVESEQSSET